MSTRTKTHNAQGGAVSVLAGHRGAPRRITSPRTRPGNDDQSDGTATHADPWVARINTACLLPSVKTTSSQQHQHAGNQENLYSLVPVTAPSSNSQPMSQQPVWIRLPKSGKLCPYTGLSRSGMNQLILGTNPPVKSISLRKRYAIRGTRLIHLGSLLAHLEAVAESQNKNSIGNNEINIEEIKKAQADLLEAIAANHLLR